MIDPKRLPQNTRIALRGQLDQTMEALRSTRLSWWSHWAALAEMFLPRRQKWFITANQYNRGSQLNAAIVDETGVIAARTCASGMMAGLTSPTRPWFRLGLHDAATQPGPVKNWLAECSRRMLKVFGESNFYEALAILYHDLSVYGSAAMILYEDAEDVIRCYNPCLGEFFFDVSDRLDVTTLYREFTLTVSQMVEKFGLAALQDTDQQAYKSGGAARKTERVICHGIEPNTELWDNATIPLRYVVPPSFKFREVYWVKGSSEAALLSMAGFKEKPFIGVRWDTVSNDAYGRSPGMDALPAVRQLQIQARRQAEAIDKIVRPPMNASVNMKNEPMSILPGAINYVANLNDSGFKPAYQITPQIADLNANILTVQQRVEKIFFNDLFTMISSLDTVRTATEIDARREEKLILLGPVIERFENEGLDTVIDRLFSIMFRRGLFPPPPVEVQGKMLNTEYISMLAEAQRAAATASIERLLQVVGNLVGVDPDAIDNVDIDLTIERYADYINVDPDLIRSIQDVMAIRQKKSQEKAAQAAAAVTPGAAQAAQTLSQTDLGGGQSALQAMIH